MPEKKIDNSKLEALLEDFAKDRQKEKYAKIMEALEPSVILVPAMPPEGLDAETEKAMKEGRPVQLPKDSKIRPCLLSRETGEQALPIFTSPAQIPQDKKSPVVLTMPFWGCLSMVMSNERKLEAMVVNPFTHNMVLPWAVLEVAEKRRAAMQAKHKTIRVTKQQFQGLVHNRVAMYLLPRYLFEKQEEGLKRLQSEEGAFLLSFYEGLYPKGARPPFAEDDFSTMTLNVTDQMQITRVDMPEEAMKKGMCYRVYTVWKRDSKELFYYTLEKTEDGSFIGFVDNAGAHGLIEPVPDNGAEIEAVMGLVSKM